MSATSQVEVMEYRAAGKHPNADTLEIFRPFGGYTVVTKIGQFKEGELVAYIPPDNVVPEKPEYAFLWADKEPTPRRRRIKVRNFRGVCSEGLLVKAPEGSSIGQDVAATIGVEHWEDVPHEPGRPANAKTGGRKVSHGPKTPRYDIEPLKRFGTVLQPDEDVVVTEKIHGANARYVFVQHWVAKIPIVRRFIKGGQFWCGSRNEWKSGQSIWQQAAHVHPGIEILCRDNPGLVLYGEVFGDVQDLKYGLSQGQVDFRAFDIYLTAERRYLDYDDFASLCEQYRVPMVPMLTTGKVAELGTLTDYAEGKAVAGYDREQVREGCVIRPRKERRDPRVGRVQLKIVGNGYLERA